MYLRVLILILLMISIPMAANAAEPINNFEVKVLPAEGQQNFSEGYFNVDAEPGEKLFLDFLVQNHSDEAMHLSLKAVDAYTADEGGILYGVRQDTPDDLSLLSNLLKIQKSVTVAPGSEEWVHFHIAIPTSANGTLLGGVMVTADGKEPDSPLGSAFETGSNYNFEQAGQRLVAVKLNLPQKTASGFSLGKAKFNSEGKQLSMRVINGKSAVLENVQGTFTILDKEGKELVTSVMKPFAMAPMSKINFPVDLMGELLEPGKYVLMIKGRADEKQFFAEEKFTVSGEEQSVIASETSGTPSPTDGSNLSRNIAIGLAALLLVLPLFVKVIFRNEPHAHFELSDKNNA